MTTHSPEAGATDILSTIKAVTEQSSQRPRPSGFSMTHASGAERFVAPVLGIYLGYSVVRLQEVYGAFAIPKLPMIMMLVFLGILGLAIPPAAWALIWKRSRPLRLVAVIAGLAIGTVPLSIWPGGSLDYLTEGLTIPITIFLSCLVFLRDRRCMRTAIAAYVLCVGAVSLNVLQTYDPNAIVLDQDGQQIAPEEVAANPELRRLSVVGVSLDPNDFGAALTVAFPLALWLSAGSTLRRLAWTSVAGLIVAGVVPTQSRGSMLGFLAATIVIIGAGARGWRRWLTIALVIGGVTLFVAMATGMGVSGRFTNFSSNDYNLTEEGGRWFIWKQGFAWMLKRPWGYGITSFPTYFGMMFGPEKAAHNTWIQYGVELGVAGLLTFVTLCGVLIGGLRRLRAIATSQSSNPIASAEGILAGHMLAVMAGVLVTGSFLSLAYVSLMYMSLGIAAATLLGTPLGISSSIESVSPIPPTSAGQGRLPRRRLRVANGR